jgi:hypothetical protein
MHQQLWGYKVEWKSVFRGMGGKRLNTTVVHNQLGHIGMEYVLIHSMVQDIV